LTACYLSGLSVSAFGDVLDDTVRVAAIRAELVTLDQLRVPGVVDTVGIAELLEHRAIAVEPVPVLVAVERQGVLVDVVLGAQRGIDVRHDRDLALVRGEGQALEAALELLLVDDLTELAQQVPVCTTHAERLEDDGRLATAHADAVGHLDHQLL